jgi:N-acetylmuramoyl-L-alanine amidase
LTTISYDHPVKDLVDRLSATGHRGESGSPPDKTFKKTSITFHHNGGVNVSHEGVLDTWTTREASAHFDVDSSGAIAQYVKIDEYAWAVGNTEGNQSSISIEQADITGSPTYEISDATFKSACRLAAWLFVHVIGESPSTANIFPHQHWSSTDCPGPWVMGRFGLYVSEVTAQYEALKGSSPSPSPTPSPASNNEDLVVDGELGEKTIRRWQEVMGTPVDGVISVPSSMLVAEVQRQLNRRIDAHLLVDGYGIVQNNKAYDTVGALQRYLGTPYDRRLSVPVSECIKQLQRRLNAGRF